MLIIPVVIVRPSVPVVGEALSIQTCHCPVRRRIPRAITDIAVVLIVVQVFTISVIIGEIAIIIARENPTALYVINAVVVSAIIIRPTIATKAAKVLDTSPSRAVIIRCPGIVARVLSERIEVNRDRIAVVVHVHDSIALGSNGFASLIRVVKMETIPPVSCTVNGGDSAIACAARSNCVRRRIDSCVFDNDRVLEVVVLAVNVLLPDDDGVVSGRICRPLGIDSRCRRKRAAEFEFITKCDYASRLVFGSVVPIIKRIAVADHVKHIRVTSIIAGFNKTRRIIGCALAILVEDEPVSLRSINGELYVTGNGKNGFIGIVVNSA